MLLFRSGFKYFFLKSYKILVVCLHWVYYIYLNISELLVMLYTSRVWITLKYKIYNVTYKSEAMPSGIVSFKDINYHVELKPLLEFHRIHVWAEKAILIDGKWVSTRRGIQNEKKQFHFTCHIYTKAFRFLVKILINPNTFYWSWIRFSGRLLER